jgi:excinuclease ABC subunit A
MGPGGGDAGGRIIAAGTVDDVVKCEASATGRILAPLP